MKVRELIWSEEKQASRAIHYTHVTASMPVSQFTITWKGWKESPSFDVESSSWGYIGSGFDLEEAKEICQNEFNRLVSQCLTE